MQPQLVSLHVLAACNTQDVCLQSFYVHTKPNTDTTALICLHSELMNYALKRESLASYTWAWNKIAWENTETAEGSKTAVLNNKLYARADKH